MPLAETLRPQTLTDFIGQKNLVGSKENPGTIRSLIENKDIPSMIFWGPPASGKTTLAKIIANSIQANFFQLSAVLDGKDKLKQIIKKADESSLFQEKTILFLDEIHRWNKAQQDSLLPEVESGKIILIGATTENPSFYINSALLSRSRVFVFEALSPEEILVGLKNGLKYLKNLEEQKVDLNKTEKKEGKKDLGNSKENPTETLTKEELQSLEILSELANGDLRFALNSLEIAFKIKKSGKISQQDILASTQKTLRYDKTGDQHYNLISAVHKSLRSSNPSAGTYWTVRMLESGEDPLYIARRLLRFASEDIGNINPNALLLANTVYETCQKLGMPECNTALIQLVEYLAKSPKSNKSYTAYKMANQDVQKYGNLEVPLHFRNAPTKLMKDLGYGKDYQYDHNLENKKSDQECFPKGLEGREYFDEVNPVKLKQNS